MRKKALLAIRIIWHDATKSFLEEDVLMRKKALLAIRIIWYDATKSSLEEHSRKKSIIFKIVKTIQ